MGMFRVQNQVIMALFSTISDLVVFVPETSMKF